MSQVIVYVRGGVVQDIDVPPDVVVHVKDYDTDGADEGVQEDEDGHFVESVWEHHAKV